MAVFSLGGGLDIIYLNSPLRRHAVCDPVTNAVINIRMCSSSICFFAHFLLYVLDTELWVSVRYMNIFNACCRTAFQEVGPTQPAAAGRAVVEQLQP